MIFSVAEWSGDAESESSAVERVFHALSITVQYSKD